MEGLICDIQRFSVQDGPGIRTTVFLQGCTLNCRWCHNPETIPAKPVVMRAKDGSQKLSAQQRPLQDVLNIVLEDKPYYETSGGGMSLSGGEPLFQVDAAVELLSMAKEAGVHTVLDTAGHVPWASFERVNPFVDLYYYDFKVSKDARTQIGADTALSLANLGKLHGLGAAIVLRCPIIPGVNDGDDHIKAIAAVLEDNPGIREVHLLAYHRLGTGKYTAISKDYTLEQVQPMDEKEKADFLAKAKQLISHPIKWG